MYVSSHSAAFRSVCIYLYTLSASQKGLAIGEPSAENVGEIEKTRGAALNNEFRARKGNGNADNIHGGAGEVRSSE